MAAIWMRFAAELRARWLVWLGLALMIGVLSGAVLASAAGARRNETSYARFLEASRAAHAATFYGAFDPSFAVLNHEQVSALPPVVESVELFYFEMDGDLDVVASADPAFATTFSVPKLVAGRLPDPLSTSEISVPHRDARTLGIEVGDPYRIEVFRAPPEGTEDPPRPFELTMTVSGIHVMPGDFPPEAGEQRFLLASPAFHRAYSETAMGFGVGFFRLEGGTASVDALRSEIEKLADGRVFFVMSQDDTSEVAAETLSLLTIALWVLAAVLAIVGVLAFGQTLARQTTIDSEGFGTIRALGMSGGQLLMIGVIRSAFTGMLAAAVACAVAVMASPLTPIGIARLIEPNPGVAIDPLVLSVGAPLVALSCVALSIVPAWRAQRGTVARGDEPVRRSRFARAVFRAGGSPAMVAGVRLALERGRGAARLPVVTTIGAAAVGLGSLLMAATFAASLDRLLSAPDLYGVRHDFEAELDVEGSRAANSFAYPAADEIREMDGVEGAAVMDVGVPVSIEGVSASGILIDPAHRELAPPLLAGRDPAGATEIVVGERTLHELGRSIGETVAMSVAGIPPKAFEIVGVAALPGFVTGEGLGEGTLALPSALRRMHPDPPPPSVVYVRLEPGADRAAVMARIRQLDRVRDVRGAEVPTTVSNLGRVRQLPAMLAAMLGLLAVAAIAHGLLSSVRRRRRELAVLRALGFVRRQVASAVAWQAVTLVVVSVLVGIPVGIAAGRGLWALTAQRLGVVFRPDVPATVLLIVVPGAILLGIVISAWPARAAARTQPALVLRAE